MAGTLVHTVEGTKPIEEVTTADQVWAFDRQTQQWRLCPVVQTFERRSDLLTHLTLDDGTELTGTVGHPFWVIEGEGLAGRTVGDHGHDETPGPTPGRWVAMSALAVGDVVLTRAGQVARVVVLETWTEAVPVYNLTVEGLHSYAVGTAGALVHNADPADYAGMAQSTTKAAATAQAKPVVEAPQASKAPEVSQPGVKPETVAPSSGTIKPTVKKDNVPWTVTENTATAYKRKPNLPQGGQWKNADGSPGVAGESFWHGPDSSVPPVKYQGQFPVFEPVEGVAVQIRMTGVRTDQTDFRRADEAFGVMLKTNSELRQQLGMPDDYR
ncbi:MAG: Hint domain-containing protein [Bacteroidales bacterium]|nr:Hint domain-containing protein [Bacteroidales bacterium]